MVYTYILYICIARKMCQGTRYPRAEYYHSGWLRGLLSSCSIHALLCGIIRILTLRRLILVHRFSGRDQDTSYPLFVERWTAFWMKLGKPAGLSQNYMPG